jgi:hypothetical protein
MKVGYSLKRVIKVYPPLF